MRNRFQVRYGAMAAAWIVAAALPGMTLGADPATRPATAPAQPGASAGPATRPGSQDIAARRALKASLRAVRPYANSAFEPLPPADRMTAPAMSSRPLPGLPQFEPGPRHVLQPAPPVTTRIPNLLTSPRKAALAVNPPLGAPAPPLSTPAVNNLDGTSALNQIPPFTRQIQIDIAVPPSIMPFENPPYLQAPNAPDDGDAPARVNAPATRPVLGQ